ncbi:MAG: glycosyltransferase family 2 protein [Anaerolineales bacterium]|nr:glycosyltransferase family 2 protein [Anaerolineales bacterium]
MNKIPEVSVVLPCLNEAKTVAHCVEQAIKTLAESGLHGEVIVSDNGSRDGSAELASNAGARVVHESRRGYGSAYLCGIAAAQAPIIIMADADNTYDLHEIPRLVAKLREGYDIVLGSRLGGVILPGAMPWLHRYVGNPILTGLLNRLFRMKLQDAHTGLRAFTRIGYDRLELSTTGMEFASEMIISAGQQRLKVTEVPITYYPRAGTSKLNTWRDGWRHLRYLMLRSPTHLFLTPGFALVLLGWLPLIALAAGPIVIWGLFFDFHYMIAGSAVALLGLQLLSLGVHGKTYLIANNLEKPDRIMEWMQKNFTLERGLFSGVVLLMIGIGFGVRIFITWTQHGFEDIFELRSGLVALTLAVSGTQVIFAALFLSMLQVKTRDD